jgi:hypothetical protein
VESGAVAREVAEALFDPAPCVASWFTRVLVLLVYTALRACYKAGGVQPQPSPGW